jgi:hypothetical protein
MPSEPFLKANLFLEPLAQLVKPLLDLGAHSPVAVAAIAVLVNDGRLVTAYAHLSPDPPIGLACRDRVCPAGWIK